MKYSLFYVAFVKYLGFKFQYYIVNVTVESDDTTRLFLEF